MWGRQDIQHNDIQHNDTQHSKSICDTQNKWNLALSIHDYDTQQKYDKP